jgi:hypothetical protein
LRRVLLRRSFMMSPLFVGGPFLFCCDAIGKRRRAAIRHDGAMR